MRKSDIDRLRKDIVEQALPSVVFDGWTMSLVEDSAKMLGHDPEVVRALFPGGVVDVLRVFSVLADEYMMAALDGVDPEDMRVGERVEFAALKRFEWLLKHQDAFCESFKVLAMPSRKIEAMKMVWRTADEIWNWSGDVSTDYNRYTKRALLSSVLVRTSLFFVREGGVSASDLKNNLNRNINSVSKFGQIKNRLKRKFS